MSAQKPKPCTIKLSDGRDCPKASDPRYQKGFRKVHTQPVCARHYDILKGENTTACKFEGCRAESKTTPGYCRRHEQVPLRQLDSEQYVNVWANALQGVQADPVSGCWIATVGIDDGRPRIQPGYRLGSWLTYRLTYHLTYNGHHNRIEGLDHLCSQPCCINPLHLMPMSAKNNNRMRNRRNLTPQAPWYLHSEFNKVPLHLMMIATLHDLPLHPWKERRLEDGSRELLQLTALPQL